MLIALPNLHCVLSFHVFEYAIPSIKVLFSLLHLLPSPLGKLPFFLRPREFVMYKDFSAKQVSKGKHHFIIN